MNETQVRPARPGDLPRLTEIYNHYIVHTPITFDIDPVTVDDRRPWLAQFAESGPHRLFVAERDELVVGYAGSHQFRTKRANHTTVETPVYFAPEITGGGIGRARCAALLEALAGEDVRMALAGITVPNEASVAIHARFGFVPAGLLHEVGRKFGRYWDVLWMERRIGGGG